MVRLSLAVGLVALVLGIPHAVIASYGPACAVTGAAGDPCTPDPLPGANADMDRVCIRLEGSPSSGHNDWTAAANDATPNDVPLGSMGFPLAGAPTVVFGMTQPFSALVLDIGAAGIDGAVHWEYWRPGAGFRRLEVADGTDSFQNSGVREVAFTPPADWGATEVFNGLLGNCLGTFYYVMAHTEAHYLALPLATKVSARVVS